MTASWKGMLCRRYTSHLAGWGSVLEIQTTKPAYAIWAMLVQSSDYFPDLHIRFLFVCFISMHADLLQKNRLHLSTGSMQWDTRNICMSTFRDGAQISSRWNLNANVRKYDPTQTNPNKYSGYNSVKYSRIITDKSKASLFWVLPLQIHIFWQINKARPRIREVLLHQVPCSSSSLLLFLWCICCSQVWSCKVLSISSDMQSTSSPVSNSLWRECSAFCWAGFNTANAPSSWAPLVLFVLRAQEYQKATEDSLDIHDHTRKYLWLYPTWPFRPNCDLPLCNSAEIQLFCKYLILLPKNRNLLELVQEEKKVIIAVSDLHCLLANSTLPAIFSGQLTDIFPLFLKLSNSLPYLLFLLISQYNFF